MNSGKYVSFKLMGENVLFWKFPQVQENGPTVIKYREIRKLEENEIVKNGQVIIKDVE